MRSIFKRALSVIAAAAASALVLFAVLFLAIVQPGGDGVLAAMKFPDGSQYMVTQSCNWGGEPYTVAFYMREAGRPWGWCYVDHEANRWWRVSMRYDETALINGGSRLHTMFRVVLPQVKPGLVAAFIFNILFVWNEFLFNYILGGQGSTMIPVLLATGVKQGGMTDWSFIAATSLIYMLPPIVAIFFFQKYLLVGMTFGTVRGEV